MRTTLVIDDDLIDKLRELGRKRRLPLRQVVDETLRRGLSVQEPQAPRHPAFKVTPFNSDFRPGVDLQRLNQLADDLEVARLTSG